MVSWTAHNSYTLPTADLYTAAKKQKQYLVRIFSSTEFRVVGGRGFTPRWSGVQVLVHGLLHARSKH